jgi:hypothetical protein
MNLSYWCPAFEFPWNSGADQQKRREFAAACNSLFCLCICRVLIRSKQVESDAAEVSLPVQFSDGHMGFDVRRSFSVCVSRGQLAGKNELISAGTKSSAPAVARTCAARG